MIRSFLSPLLLMICVIATISVSGCGPEAGTGHAEDKTPGSTPTPPMDSMMSEKGMDDYAAEQAKKAAEGTTAAP